MSENTDVESTDRYEVKREAEAILKTDFNFNLNAGLNVSAKAPGDVVIVTNLAAGMSTSRNQSDQVKTTNNFAKEVVNRAVKQIQSKVASARTTTRIFETEEHNTHRFDNQTNENVSGVYAWLDKVYCAQVFNYGKRLMFEFMVPEPAAFLVESRLHAFESGVQRPLMPSLPTLDQLSTDIDALRPSDVDRLYDEWAIKYDLSDLPRPEEKKSLELINPETNLNMFGGEKLEFDGRLVSRTFTCRVQAMGYKIDVIEMEGDLRIGIFPPHMCEVWIDGHRVISELETKLADWQFGVGGQPQTRTGYFALADGDKWDMTSDEVVVTFVFRGAVAAWLALHLHVSAGSAAKQAWATKVLRRIRDIERKKVDASNSGRMQEYQSAMVAYQNKLEQLQGLAVNDVLQGFSEAENTNIIVAELKRAVLAQLTKDFDASKKDNVLTSVSGMADRKVPMYFHSWEVDEPAGGDVNRQVKVSFAQQSREVAYPLVDLPNARRKGKMVQFLEQAFDWQHLAFAMYPHYWGHENRWVELMNRFDRADPSYTAFLQAGYAKVLVSVTPSFEDAVAYYLRTGIPWDGGETPVIGDPLFVPIHVELRNATDDMEKAVADGESWEYRVPTQLVYLKDSSTKLDPLDCSKGP